MNIFSNSSEQVSEKMSTKTRHLKILKEYEDSKMIKDFDDFLFFMNIHSIHNIRDKTPELNGSFVPYEFSDHFLEIIKSHEEIINDDSEDGVEKTLDLIILHIPSLRYVAITLDSDSYGDYEIGGSIWREVKPKKKVKYDF